MLATFCVLWVSVVTVRVASANKEPELFCEQFCITFAPKILSVWQTAAGFLPDRETDSKNKSGSGTRSQNAQFKTLKARASLGLLAANSVSCSGFRQLLYSHAGKEWYELSCADLCSSPNVQR